MSSLPILELILGSSDLWPRDILRYLFLVSPSPDTIYDIALFFFGNDIPLVLALDFFRESSGSSPTSDSLVSIRFIYYAFHTNEPNRFEYYDMTVGGVVRSVNRHVTLVENNGQIPIGFGDDIFPLMS